MSVIFETEQSDAVDYRRMYARPEARAGLFEMVIVKLGLARDAVHAGYLLITFAIGCFLISGGIFYLYVLSGGSGNHDTKQIARQKLQTMTDHMRVIK